MLEDLLQIRNLSISYQHRSVLHDLRFNLKQGEFVSLVGPSGCGKSTLLRIVADLQKPDSGEINYNFSEKKNIDMSFVFQRTPLFPWLTLEQNLLICMNNLGMSDDQKKVHTIRYLKRAHLEKYAQHFPAQVSGGMQQKVNVLRAFCSGASLILMDEPFVSLDFIQRTELQEFTLEILKLEKKTVLFVTHNISEAILLSDRVVVMAGTSGKIVKDFEVNLPSPRNLKMDRTTFEFIELFEKISNLLDTEIRKTFDPISENE